MSTINWIVISVVFIFILKYAAIIGGYLVSMLIIRVERKKQGNKAPAEYKHTKGKRSITAKIKSVLLGAVRYLTMYTGKIPSNTIRNFLYKNVFLVKLEENVVIRYGLEMRRSYNLHIKKGAVINEHVVLDAANGIVIGENVNISRGVWIWTEQHNVNSEWFSCVESGGAVTIGNRAWISSGVVILPGVTIGEGAVIAAGAVVTKDVAPFSINGGIPSKKIGERNRELKYEFVGNRLSFY